MRIATSKGFTLLEVVIALVIMTFLSLFTVRAIRSALQTKSKVQKTIDQNSTLRDALHVMERDINMAFNYRDVSLELYNQAQQLRSQTAQSKSGANPPPTPAGTPAPTPAPAPTGLSAADAQKYQTKPIVVWTQFQGDADRLDFTTLSNVRMTEDAAISSQAEVGYYLKSCHDPIDPQSTSQCLWRRVSNYIHKDITKDGDSSVLLQNVAEFKLRYLGPGVNGDNNNTEEWLDSWKSGEGADDRSRGKFPYAVEITIAIKGPKEKLLRMTTVAAIRNPNNPPPNTNNPGAQSVLPTQ